MDLSHAQKPNNPSENKESYQPVLWPSFKILMINDIIPEINNILSVDLRNIRKWNRLFLKVYLEVIYLLKKFLFSNPCQFL